MSADKRKLRVGLWVPENFKPDIGGSYTYYSQLINAMQAFKFNDAEIIYITYDGGGADLPFTNSYFIKGRPFKWTAEKRAIRKAGSMLLKKDVYGNRDQELKDELNRVIDVIYYPVPVYENIIHNFPFIYTLWDVGHHSTYPFPELSMNSVFEFRKKHHDYIVTQALRIFVESETGKKEAAGYLCLNKERVSVVPLFPSEIISEKIIPAKPKKIEKDAFYIHYPAQFWAHKNHYNLIVALKKVVEVFPQLKLILTGSDKGNKKYIFETIQQLNLQDAVVDMGFVSVEELKWIYQHSRGLVMPSFLGPTNMPLLEAASLGCPVACSHFDGHKEMLGDYGYYFNPLSSEEMAQAIIQMIQEKQQGHTKQYTPRFTIEAAIQQIDKAFTEIKSIRFCWGHNDQIF